MSSLYTESILEDGDLIQLIDGFIASGEEIPLFESNDSHIKTYPIVEQPTVTVAHNPDFPSMHYLNVSSSPQWTSESGFYDGSDTLTHSSYPRSTPGLLSPCSQYDNSPSPNSSVSSINGEYPIHQPFIQGPMNEVSINISEGMKHKYRHAKEMKIGHGGLKGDITLPTGYNFHNYQLILSVVPSAKSTQKIHPCMLHVTVMNQGSKQKRAKYRTELKSAKDWKVVLYVKKGRVFYQPNYKMENDMIVDYDGEMFEIDCIENGRIVLGGNNLQVRFEYQKTQLDE